MRGKLAESQAQLTKSQIEIARLNCENVEQSNRLKDLTLRLMYVESREVAIPLARDRSRETETCPAQPERNSWMTDEQWRFNLLRPNSRF